MEFLNSGSLQERVAKAEKFFFDEWQMHANKSAVLLEWLLSAMTKDMKGQRLSTDAWRLLGLLLPRVNEVSRPLLPLLIHAIYSADESVQAVLEKVFTAHSDKVNGTVENVFDLLQNALKEKTKCADLAVDFCLAIIGRQSAKRCSSLFFEKISFSEFDARSLAVIKRCLFPSENLPLFDSLLKDIDLFSLYVAAANGNTNLSFDKGHSFHKALFDSSPALLCACWKVYAECSRESPRTVRFKFFVAVLICLFRAREDCNFAQCLGDVTSTLASSGIYVAANDEESMRHTALLDSLLDIALQLNGAKALLCAILALNFGLVERRIRQVLEKAKQCCDAQFFEELVTSYARANRLESLIPPLTAADCAAGLHNVFATHFAALSVYKVESLLISLCENWNLEIVRALLQSIALNELFFAAWRSSLQRIFERLIDDDCFGGLEIVIMRFAPFESTFHFGAQLARKMPFDAEKTLSWRVLEASNSAEKDIVAFNNNCALFFPEFLACVNAKKLKRYFKHVIKAELRQDSFSFDFLVSKVAFYEYNSIDLFFKVLGKQISKLIRASSKSKFFDQNALQLAAKALQKMYLHNCPTEISQITQHIATELSDKKLAHSLLVACGLAAEEKEAAPTEISDADLLLVLERADFKSLSFVSVLTQSQTEVIAEKLAKILSNPSDAVLVAWIPFIDALLKARASVAIKMLCMDNLERILAADSPHKLQLMLTVCRKNKYMTASQISLFLVHLRGKGDEGLEVLQNLAVAHARDISGVIAPFFKSLQPYAHSDLSRIFQAFKDEKKRFGKLVPYFIFDNFGQLTRRTVFSCLDLCGRHEITFLMSVLDDEGKLKLKEIYADYEKNHKFDGKI